ncbi:hypothetical protein KIW84_032501 [Lathyrus oleraceus]|uniref:Pentatricopeptide repeat-containing protein n=1 Tax=Pisum sativum TaxID=3888 RepID=A0A9D5B1Y2_PEA|nr:hypothetical protein KIW84_032501 [Pisum sativum]
MTMVCSIYFGCIPTFYSMRFFVQSLYFTIIFLSNLIFSSAARLHDWKTAVDVIKYMEPSLPVISSGCLNLFLNSLGKSGKIETMLKLFFKMLTSGAEVNFNTYSILLKNLLSSGNWRKYLEVLQWMEDAGIHPSNEMYRDISSFSKCCGAENAAVIKERLGNMTIYLPFIGKYYKKGITRAMLLTKGSRSQSENTQSS